MARHGHYEKRRCRRASFLCGQGDGGGGKRPAKDQAEEEGTKGPAGGRVF